MIEERKPIQFISERQELIWLQDQVGLLWEFVNREGLADDAEIFIKENGGDIENFSEYLNPIP